MIIVAVRWLSKLNADGADEILDVLTGTCTWTSNRQD